MVVMARQDFSELNETALLIDFRLELTRLCRDYEKKGLSADTIILTLHNCEFIMLAKRQRDAKQ